MSFLNKLQNKSEVFIIAEAGSTQIEVYQR